MHKAPRLRPALLGALLAPLLGLSGAHAAVTLDAQILSDDKERLIGYVTAIAAGDEGSLYTADSRDGLLVHFGADGRSALPLAGKDHVFSSSRVRGLVRLGPDRYAVANEGDGKVAIIDGKGAVLARFGDGGGDEGRLNSPAGLAWSLNRRLYVADKHNNRISVFGPDGVYLRTLGGQEGARLDTPEQVYVDHRERVYVFERRSRGTLTVFSHDGALLHRTDAAALGKAARVDSMRLTTLAVDPATALVYLGDSENGRIHLYDWETGTLQAGFGTKGSQRGQFSEISALELLSDGRLAVADNDNKKIEIYRLPPSDRPVLQRLHLPTLTQAGTLTLECDLAYHAAEGRHWCLSRRTGGTLRDGAGNTALTLQDTLEKPVAAAFGADRIALIDDTRLKIFAADGSLLFSSGDNRPAGNDPFGTGGNQFDAATDGKFSRPADLYLHGERIHVVDSANRRLQIFSRDGLYLDKIDNPKSRPWLFEEPVAVAVDSRGNIYVGDSELKQVLIFDKNKQPLGKLDGGELPGEKFSDIFDLEIDADDNLYVLCATPKNEATVQVYRNRQPAFSFGARSADAGGFAKPANLSLAPSAQGVVALYDRERKQLLDFNYLQVPAAVADFSVSGGTRSTELRWGALRNSYIAAYRVYGAADARGPYTQLAEVQEPRAVLDQDGRAQSRYYRIAAVSGFGVEGPASEPAEDLFQAGHAHYRAGAWTEAEAAFRRQHEDHPNHAETNQYLGLTLMELQQYAAARQHFETLARQPGHEAEGARLLVGAWRAAGDDVAAKGVVERALAGSATQELRLLCGELSLALNDAIGAVQCLEDALKADGNDVNAHLMMADAYIRLGVMEQGLGELATARELAPEDPKVWRRSAQIQQRLGAHEAAVELYGKTLELAPDDLESRLALARSHRALGQLDRVRNIALGLTAHSATEGDGHYLLGVVALEEGKHGEALIALTKATRSAPKHAAAWLALADAYGHMKQDKMIPTALEKAMAADTGSFDAAWRLGQYNYQQGQYAAAAEPLARAVALRPDSYDAHYLLADVLLRQNDLKESFRMAAEAARMAPEKVEPLALLGAVSARQGKNGAAINYLKQALAKQPNDLALQLQLGTLYVDNNMFDQARSSLEQAALLDATRAEPQALLGRLYLKRRLFDEAIAALDKAVTLNPSEANRLLLDTAYAEKNKALEFKSNAPQIVLKDLQLQPVFSAAYKQYANAPIGTIRIHNTSGIDYGNLKLTFDIKGYMDFPTAQDIAELKANSIIDLPLHASFNNRVLEIDEDTGVQVEVALRFVRDGRDDAITLTQPMTLYGKNAILWSRSNMVGAFVTPRDDTLRDFVRQAINENRPAPGPLNANIVTAMTLFDALSAHGVKYVTDPNSPYSKMAADQVDYVQFARETLKLKSGDCDDLTVLLAAALENLGIETAILDVPGHLLMMFNTGLPAADAGLISMQDDLLAVRDGRIWLPLEATMIATSFAEAWTEGARKYRDNRAAGTLKEIALHKTWEEYVPVTLKQADYRIEVPASERVAPLVQREYNLLLEKSLDRLVRPYRAMLAANPANEAALMQIAIIYARNGLYDKAFQTFDELLQKNPDSSSAYNNRGNIYFTRGEFDRALKSYGQAELIDGSDAGIKVNLAMTHYKLGRLDGAKEKFAEAQALDAGVKTRYDAFARLLAN